MKKLMTIALVAVAMSMGVYAEEAKAEAKAEAKPCDKAAVKMECKGEMKACEGCAKLNKDLKEGEQPKYCCDACKKKAEEAAAKKAAEAKKEEAK